MKNIPNIIKHINNHREDAPTSLTSINNNVKGLNNYNRVIMHIKYYKGTSQT